MDLSLLAGQCTGLHLASSKRELSLLAHARPPLSIINMANRKVHLSEEVLSSNSSIDQVSVMFLSSWEKAVIVEKTHIENPFKRHCVLVESVAAGPTGWAALVYTIT